VDAKQRTLQRKQARSGQAACIGSCFEGGKPAEMDVDLTIIMLGLAPTGGASMPAPAAHSFIIGVPVLGV
jgi:hypothetical protein